MEKPQKINVLELTQIHKATVDRLEELQDRFYKIDEDAAHIVNNLLEDFLVGSITSTEALRRASVLRDAIGFVKK